jgi:hypothetical protein
MLIYASSYPRSGNSLMQQIVNVFFEYPWTEVDRPRKPLNEITGVPHYFENWRYSEHPWHDQSTQWQRLWKRANRKLFKFYNLEDWIALYDLKIPPSSNNCRYLLPGCRDVLTPQNRQKLANEDTIFFVKTHDLPFQQYFDNEYVVQIVRHPGPVLWSYQNLLNDFYNQKRSLEEVISGMVPYGSWSHWHQEWQDKSQGLGDRFLQLKYENILAVKRQDTCEQISQMIGISYNAEQESLSLEELQKRNPKYYHPGNNEKWKQRYTPDQMDLLCSLHHNTMMEFSYVV